MSFLYELDILNTHPLHTLTKTTTGDKIKWELKDGSSDHVNAAEGMLGDDDNVLRKLRNNLGFDDTVLPCLTTVQAGTVTVKDGQQILNTITKASQVKSDGSWR